MLTDNEQKGCVSWLEPDVALPYTDVGSLGPCGDLQPGPQVWPLTTIFHVSFFVKNH